MFSHHKFIYKTILFPLKLNTPINITAPKNEQKPNNKNPNPAPQFRLLRYLQYTKCYSKNDKSIHSLKWPCSSLTPFWALLSLAVTTLVRHTRYLWSPILSRSATLKEVTLLENRMCTRDFFFFCMHIPNLHLQGIFGQGEKRFKPRALHNRQTNKQQQEDGTTRLCSEYCCLTGRQSQEALQEAQARSKLSYFLLLLCLKTSPVCINQDVTGSENRSPA